MGDPNGDPSPNIPLLEILRESSRTGGSDGCKQLDAIISECANGLFLDTARNILKVS
jgi:hypothetical protein